MRDERVDTDVEAGVAPARRRRRLLRLLFPLFTALALVVAIVLITLYAERVNRRDALALTEEVVGALEATVRLELEAYLAPTASAVRLLAGTAASDVAGALAADRELERQMRSAMRAVPELAAVFAGDAAGDFLMVQRDGERLRTKLIQAGPERVVRWIERDGDGRIVGERADPEDRFDPRERPWFAAARAAHALVWSEVYRFFTTGAPGVTASLAAGGERAVVVGADLEIGELGRFLQGLRIGERGRAVITTPDGELVAHPPRLAPRDGEGVPTVFALDDAVLTEAFERFRIARGDRGVVIIDGVRHLVSAVSLADVVGRDWWALLVAPEATFIGFVAANARTSLALSAVVVVLAMVVGVLLTIQGLQSDARADRALRAADAARAQGATLDALAAVDGLADAGDADALRRFATIVADALAAGRVSVWRLDASGTALSCLECYDRERGAHTAAATLPADHLGEAWPRLTGTAPFTTTTADGEDELRPLRALYLEAAGSERLTVRPIVASGRSLGSLWLEDADAAQAGPLAPALEGLAARLLAPRLNALSGGETAVAAPAELAPRRAAMPPPLAQRREQRVRRAVTATAGTQGARAVLVPNLAVLEVRLGDDAALARADPEHDTIALAHVVEAATREAERLGVRHRLLRGDRLVAAVEGGEDDGAAATRAVAELALALQAPCRELARAAGTRAGFRAGIDVGPAFAATIASRTALWGESCRLAARMAESAPPTAVQLTEAAYDRLARDYLVRRRGSFFLDGVGAVATYLLAGRL